MSGINVIRKFLRLKDVDKTDLTAGYLVRVNATEDGVEFIDPGTVGGAGNLVDLGDVTGTPGTGKAPVSNGSGQFPLTDVATQAELDAEASTRASADAAAIATAEAYSDAALAAHVAASDPHTGYQKESEKGQANGYASLDGSALVPDSQIPSGIARDSEVTAAVAAEASARDAAIAAALAAADGSGLSDNGSGVLSVNVDGSSIEISADTLRVKADGITSSHIAADAVGSSEIAANAVGSSELADDAVDTAAIQDGAVTSAKIANGTIVDADVNAAAAIAATKIAIADAGSYLAATDVEAAIQEIAASLSAASADANRKSVTQVGHGLAVGDVVRLSGGAFVKAKADNAANAEAVGIVSAVADSSHFTLTTAGYITLSGLVADSVYYLSAATAGLLTATEPTTAGYVSKPMLVAVSTTVGIVINYRGAIIPTALPTVGLMQAFDYRNVGF